MDEDWPDGDETWDAGFESDRRLVVARWGPFLRVYPRPAHYLPRFHHRVYELPVVDWSVPVAPLNLGTLCSITAELKIRFQPTLRYARENLEHLGEIAGHVQRSQLPLLQDVAERELQRMEWDAGWLEQGCSAVERALERAVSEHLAVRNIQSRARCLVQPAFGDLGSIPADSVAPWSRHRTLYRTLLERHRQAQEEHHRTVTEHHRLSRERELERENQLLELERQRQELAKARLESEIEQLKTELAAEERRQAERREAEARLHQEQISHAASLRTMEMEADQEEKIRRAQTMDEMENHLKREIELLAMERQRLLLEEEIREVKVAKAKGWVIHAKRRFPLGNHQEPPPEEEPDPSQPPESTG